MSRKGTNIRLFIKKALTIVTLCVIILSQKVTAMKLNLRICRIRKGLTQKDIAEILKVGSNTVSQWESGRREPSISNLKRIAEICECSLDELLRDESTQPTWQKEGV